MRKRSKAMPQFEEVTEDREGYEYSWVGGRRSGLCLVCHDEQQEERQKQ